MIGNATLKLANYIALCQKLRLRDCINTAVTTSSNPRCLFSSPTHFYWTNVFAAVPVICFGFQVRLGFLLHF